MNKTLFRYIGLDLLKATGLTLIVLTLTLSMLGIIEPLRKQGLDGSLAMLVFAMTLPVMLSLTMPFAALFAACFVYGRFSQDNELLASRASGISTIALLRPALALGIVVTLASWSLSNYVAPVMARKGFEATANNIRGMMCRRLAMRGFLAFKDFTIHADRVHRYTDKDYDKFEGIIVVKRTGKGGHVEIMSARTARARFGINHDQRAFLNITLEEAVIMSSDNPSVRTETVFPLDDIVFDRRIKEKPAWYSWSELLATLADPSKSITVQQAIPKIQQSICSSIFTKRITETLRTTGLYDKFTKHNERFVIKAPNVSVSDQGRITLSSGKAGNARLVEITRIRDGIPVKKATASIGEIKITWNEFTKAPEVSISLTNALLTNLDIPDDDPTGIGAATIRKNWLHGNIRIPEDIRAEMDKITPHKAYHNGGKGGGLTDNPSIHGALDLLNNDHVVRLRRDIISELHMRLAYSLSCLLMVMLGGVLGLIFRGGQFVSALVTATVPASAVVITILMGKNIAQNPDVLFKGNPDASIAMGITIMWGGIAMLAVATGLTYWMVSKK